MLIIFSGLPGVGKTTLSRELACRTNATYLRIDSIERAMTLSSLKIHPTEDAGYMVGYAVATDNLRLGRIVIADSVNALDLTRDAWLKAATKTESKSAEIEVVCSDSIEHRERIEMRRSKFRDHNVVNPPTWQSVLEREYQPWVRDRVQIDTAGRSVTDCVGNLLTRLHAEAGMFKF